jgi:succinate dehydrogenase / fumarate reductase, cytochrome b subunit
VSEASAAKSFFDKSRRPFLLRKLHSLTGIVPVGGYLVFHLWENATALQGQERFDETVVGISRMPYLPVLEAFILLPLLFHAGYGVKLALAGKPNVGRYTYSRNWMYFLQRLTGLLAFAFIAFHLYEYWWQKEIGKMVPEQFYSALCANMSSTMGGIPVRALAYMVGIAASVFHFANGLWGFCFSWGITVSRRSQQLAATVFGIVGVVVFVLGANTALYFATGSRLPGTWLGPPSGSKAASRTCADIPGGTPAEAIPAPAAPAAPPP